MEFLRNKIYRGLRSSEKYTKTDMVYLTKGSFWLNWTTVGGFISSFFLLYIFANHFSTVDFGIYRYLLSFYALLALFTLSGFNTALTRSVSKNNDGDFFAAFRWQFLSSLLVSIVTFVISAYYYINDNSTLGTGFLIMALALPLMEPLDLYHGLLTGKKMFRGLALTSVVSTTITTILIALAVIITKKILIVLVVYYISWIAVKAFFYFRFKRLISNNSRTPGFTKLGVNFSLANMVNGVASYIDRVLLFQLVGAHELAIYSFASAPPEQIKGFFKNLSSLILPKLSQRSEKEIMSGLFQKVMTMALIIAPILILYIFVIPYLFSWFFPQYMESVPYSRIYIISLIGILVIPVNAAMSAIPKVKAMVVTNIISPIISLPVTVILIFSFGLWGAVYSKLATRLIQFIVSIITLVTFKPDTPNSSQEIISQ